MQPYLIGAAQRSANNALFSGNSNERNVPEVDSVLNKFGSLMEKIEPETFYDVSALPYAKDAILKALLLRLALSF